MNKNIRSVLFLLSTLVFLYSPLLGANVLSAAELTSSKITAAITPDNPAWIYIPKLNLFSQMEGVGVTSDGKMAVPSGKTTNVGWYMYGVTPGNIGTAVLDAHNTAAFKHLNQLSNGDDIYILTQTGKFLHFAVNKTKTYSMKVLTSDTLFAQSKTRKINLITCAGGLLPDGTADSRLIVSAELI